MLQLKRLKAMKFAINMLHLGRPTYAGRNDSSIPEYFGLLDQLRFLAALVVVIYHYPLFFRLPDLASGSALSPVRPEVLHAELAVPFFWTLSGFVFFFQYRDRSIGAIRFARQRFARLYPLHFATLLMVATLQFVSLKNIGETIFFPNNDVRHFLLNLTFMSSWGFEDGLSFNAPVWSVSVEILVYAAFFLFLPGLRWSVAVSLALIAISFFTYKWLGQHVALLCAVYFFTGCVCFEIVRRIPTTTLAAIGIIFLVIAYLNSEYILYTGETMTRIFIFAGIILLTCAIECRFRKLAPAPHSSLNLGNYSYGVYLIHVPVMLATANVSYLILGDDTLVFSSPFMLAFHLLVCVSLACVAFFYLELPAKLKLNSMGIR